MANDDWRGFHISYLPFWRILRQRKDFGASAEGSISLLSANIMIHADIHKACLHLHLQYYMRLA